MNEGGVSEVLQAARSHAEAGNLLLAAEKFNEAVISSPSNVALVMASVVPGPVDRMSTVSLFLYSLWQRSALVTLGNQLLIQPSNGRAAPAAIGVTLNPT